MNKIISLKRISTILGALLIGASQIFVAQAQIAETDKIGRDDIVVKQETEASFTQTRTVSSTTGDPRCKDLSQRYQELVVDPPRSRTYTFAENNTVAVKFYGGNNDLTYVDFQSSLAFVAVIVKNGNERANIYTYSDGQTFDVDLATPNLRDISRVSFCYVPNIVTAASASVGGSVTNVSGRGVARSYVTIQNLNTEETRTVVTNAFGFYRFNDLPIGDLYVVTIVNKKAGLASQTAPFVLHGNEENMNFTAP